MVELLLPGSFSAYTLSLARILARISGNVLPRWQSAHRCSTLHFFAGLSSAAGQRNSSRLRDAALVVHVVDQILLQMLGAEQMHRCVEDVRMRIGKSQ